jgi:L-fuculose-phosphate aldolase
MAAGTSRATSAEVPRRVLSTLQAVGRDLYYLGLVSSHGGNLSMRAGHEMWITGTGTMLGRLEERHISHILADGRSAGPPPSADTVLHTTIYALGQAQAIVHAHPRHAVALSFDTDSFVPEDLEGQVHLGEVPVVPPGPNSTSAIAAAMQSRVVVLLRGHGAYARGQTLWEALHWITALEESAEITVIRRLATRR